MTQTIVIYKPDGSHTTEQRDLPTVPAEKRA